MTTYTLVAPTGEDSTFSTASKRDLSELPGSGDEVEAGGKAREIQKTLSGAFRQLETADNTALGSVTLAPDTDAGFDSGLIYNGDLACFYVGTMIATPSGAVLVEEIKAGDLVLAASGRALPVRWVGRSYVSTQLTDPLRCLPIRIKAGALAEGIPTRDLLVSPDQALFINDVLVHAGGVVNGTTIIREAAVPKLFAYYHVELASHDLLLAEGTPAESFVDRYVDQINVPNWARGDAPRVTIREMEYPRAKSARQVPMAIRRQLAARTEQFGLSLPGAS